MQCAGALPAYIISSELVIDQRRPRFTKSRTPLISASTPTFHFLRCIRVLLPDPTGFGMFSMRLIVFFEHSTINTQSPAWYESRIGTDIDSFHFFITFSDLAFFDLNLHRINVNNSMVFETNPTKD
jgi:hypothetical protein